jgi:hypothetical protein
MVTLEDPITVAHDLIDEQWKTVTGGQKPNLIIRREQKINPGFCTPEGLLLFYEQNHDRVVADVFHNHEDVEVTFAVEVRGPTYDRMATIWAELERIRRLNISRPGSQLATPDDTFHLWEIRDSPPNWEGVGNFRRLVNYDMRIWNQTVRS